MTQQSDLKDGKVERKGLLVYLSDDEREILLEMQRRRPTLTTLNAAVREALYTVKKQWDQGTNKAGQIGRLADEVANQSQKIDSMADNIDEILGEVKKNG